VNAVTTALQEAGKGRFRWTVVAFMLAGLLISGLVVWQLYETAPRIWCEMAKEGHNDQCVQILLRLLDIKNNALLGLIAILGLTVVSLTAIALGLKISAGGPGDTHIDVGADRTTVDTGGSTVVIPTPPSGDK
jgi:uncharacterized membrane protein SpoIIM required for sporulation